MKGDDEECLLAAAPNRDDIPIAVAVAQLRRRQRGRDQFHFTTGIICGLLVSIVLLLLLITCRDAGIIKNYGEPNLDTIVHQVEIDANGFQEPWNGETRPNHVHTSKDPGENAAKKNHKEASNSGDSMRFKPESVNDPNNQTCGVTETDRFDCWPEFLSASQEKCEARGCCWNPSLDNGVPFCFYPTDFVGYAVTSSSSSATGMTAKLAMKTPSPYPNNVQQLQVDVTYLTQSVLRFKVYDPNNQRFEAPLNVTQHKTPPQSTDYAVVMQNSPFGIYVYRKSTGAILFDSRNLAPLLFADQYLQIATRLSSSDLYGLGEHQFGLNLGVDWRKLVMWNRDQPPDGGGNLYGYHPFYLNLESNGNAHGVFLLSSNALEVAIQPYAGGQGSLTYRSLGGVLDFYVFSGSSPISVVEQYVSLIGRPFMPPFWSLGFHLCKYGYMSAKNLSEVIARNRAANIPYDVQWNDIDYMEAYKDWTYDAKGAYQGLPDIVDDLHAHNQRYIMIIDPGISSTQPAGSYPPYDDGVSMDIFMKNATGQIMIGKVWPGETAFPDFFHPNANQYWFKQMQSYHKLIDFDGIWIDMNEISNFVDGSTVGCTNNLLDNPPYVPPDIDGKSLKSRTVCPSSKQYLSTSFNLHNMYGWSEMRATMGGLKQLRGKRSFVLSRSTYPGSGVYGAHWTGDNRSGWPDLYFSIPNILLFNMFGVTMVGADVCGFGGDEIRELCIRWMQLAAFYPFFRNHDSLRSEPQDPAVFDVEALGYMRDALETRYSLLPMMYTWFYRSHTTGTPVIRPLFMLFPNTQSMDRQFMWGDCLLVSPVLDQGAVKVDAYFPKGLWYDLYNGSRVPTQGEESLVLDAPMGTIHAHIRGGSIIPRLPSATTTDVMRTKPFFLQVAPDEQFRAQGLLFWDDGESLDTIEHYAYTLLNFTLNGNKLSSSVVHSHYPGMQLDRVQIFGIQVKPLAVVLNQKTAVPYDFDPQNHVMTAYNLNVDLLTPFTLSWLL